MIRILTVVFIFCVTLCSCNERYFPVHVQRTHYHVLNLRDEEVTFRWEPFDSDYEGWEIKIPPYSRGKFRIPWQERWKTNEEYLATKHHHIHFNYVGLSENSFSRDYYEARYYYRMSSRIDHFRIPTKYLVIGENKTVIQFTPWDQPSKIFPKNLLDE